jgi:hypothetical protein
MAIETPFGRRKRYSDQIGGIKLFRSSLWHVFIYQGVYVSISTQCCEIFGGAAKRERENLAGFHGRRCANLKTWEVWVSETLNCLTLPY